MIILLQLHRLNTLYPNGVQCRVKSNDAGQVNEHFGVREDWPPLSQPTVSAIVRGYSDGWGARMMADADASSLTSAEFWVEVRTEAAVHVPACGSTA
jgi:hypothetical protein